MLGGKREKNANEADKSDETFCKMGPIKAE